MDLLTTQQETNSDMIEPLHAIKHDVDFVEQVSWVHRSKCSTRLSFEQLPLIPAEEICDEAQRQSGRLCTASSLKMMRTY